MALEPRRAARLLVVDPAGRVLLLHGHDPSRPEWSYWFTVGGAVDPGETPAEAAAREAREEVGLVVDAAAVGQPRWHQSVEIPFGDVWYLSDQDFFLVRVDPFDVSFAGLDAEERATIDRWAWWSAAELEATDERFYPDELPTLLREMLAG